MRCGLCPDVMLADPRHHELSPSIVVHALVLGPDVREARRHSRASGIIRMSGSTHLMATPHLP